jgi:hypothetical protein
VKKNLNCVKVLRRDVYDRNIELQKCRDGNLNGSDN